MIGRLILALLALGPVAAFAAPAPIAAPDEARAPGDFGRTTASPDVRDLAAWAIASRDTRNLPFLIVDKRNARVFVFDRAARLLANAPALVGLAPGDSSVPGIGQRRLATITPGERTTPAGRFQAALGHDFEQDVLWIDYEAALSLHRVILGRAADRRHQRLASKSTLDNRISYGCINVPVEFYDRFIAPTFTGTVGIVYILPDTKALRDVFPIPGRRALGVVPN